MKPVKIYTYSQWRPDFIPIQYETIKRFVKDDFEYIVFNNGVDSPSQRNAVSYECDKPRMNDNQRAILTLHPWWKAVS